MDLYRERVSPHEDSPPRKLEAERAFGRAFVAAKIDSRRRASGSS